MRIHAIDIARRKELLGFHQHDAQLLKACRPFMQLELNGLIDTFKQLQAAEVALAQVIGDPGSQQRLHAAMLDYTRALFSGVYEEQYVNERLRIGQVHQRIGIAPQYYLSAMRLLKNLLMEALNRNLAGHPDREATCQALDKLLYFDMAFVFDTHISGMLAEIESARNEVVEHALKLEEMVAERTRELNELTRRDPLTGLFNRRAFAESLSSELCRGKRTGHPLTLLYIDVDSFKQINDSRGHLTGDEVLRKVGGALARQCRPYDMSCRYGGDEFCLLLPATEEAEGLEVACRVQEAMTRGGMPRLSIGVAQAGPACWPTPEHLVHAADQAMYLAKRQGGGTVMRASSGGEDVCPAGVVDAS